MDKKNISSLVLWKKLNVKPWGVLEDWLEYHCFISNVLLGLLSLAVKLGPDTQAQTQSAEKRSEKALDIEARGESD